MYRIKHLSQHEKAKMGNDFNQKAVTTISPFFFLSFRLLFFIIILRLRLLGNLKKNYKQTIWSLDSFGYTCFTLFWWWQRLRWQIYGLQRINGSIFLSPKLLVSLKSNLKFKLNCTSYRVLLDIGLLRNLCYWYTSSFVQRIGPFFKENV